MKEHNCSYSTRIGKTTFIVNVKQSETAQKPLNTLFQEICKHEVLEDCSADKSSILGNHKKIILTKSIPREPDTEQERDSASSLTCRSNEPVQRSGRH